MAKGQAGFAVVDDIARTVALAGLPLSLALGGWDINDYDVSGQWGPSPYGCGYGDMSNGDGGDPFSDHLWR